jgi:molybdopterin synthase sulfur carrier subunit
LVTLHFTQNIQRHIACPQRSLSGQTVREVLEGYFSEHPGARTYVLDDQGALRQHMMIFVDGGPIADRGSLSDAVEPDSELHVIQALSGG